MTKVPDNYSFTLKDVRAALGAHGVFMRTWNLQGSFTNADPLYFDPNYEGQKDGLRNFRNYGPRYDGSYGWLYNWYAVVDNKGLAPDGWRVPSDTEWAQLVDYVVAQGFPNEQDEPNGAANALKSCRQVDSPLGGDCDTSEHPRWNYNDTHHGFNEFGFLALPAGYRPSNGYYYGIGAFGYWWSSSEQSSTNAWNWEMGSGEGHVTRFSDYKRSGFSVRCIQDKAAGESDGTTGTLTDIDGNVYTWVVIGDLRWMAENLRTTKYRDGTNIPNVIDHTDWENLSTGARCAPDGNEDYVYP